MSTTPPLPSFWMLVTPEGDFLTDSRGSPLVSKTRPGRDAALAAAIYHSEPAARPVQYTLTCGDDEGYGFTPEEMADPPNAKCKCPICRKRRGEVVTEKESKMASIGETLARRLAEAVGGQVVIRDGNLAIIAPDDDPKPKPQCEAVATGGERCEKEDHGNDGVHLGRTAEGLEVVW